MSVPYDYDPSNIEHLRAVIDEQEAVIEYLRECCKEMEAENARLRSCLSDDVENARMIMGENSRLREQNAKFRELATGLYRCWQGEECEGCPMQDDDGWCVRDIQLRKLGVEL